MDGRVATKAITFSGSQMPTLTSPDRWMKIRQIPQVDSNDLPSQDLHLPAMPKPVPCDLRLPLGSHAQVLGQSVPRLT